MGLQKSATEIMREHGYSWISSFAFNRACAQKDGKQFHIKPDGTRAYRNLYDWVGLFDKEGRAHARLGDEWFMIGTDGQKLKAPKINKS